VSRWETSLKFGFLGQMLQCSGMLDAIAVQRHARRVGKEREWARQTQVERTMLAMQQRDENDAKGADWIEAGRAAVQGGVQPRLVRPVTSVVT
jgi:hypothetical protein